MRQDYKHLRNKQINIDDDQTTVGECIAIGILIAVWGLGIMYYAMVQATGGF